MLLVGNSILSVCNLDEIPFKNDLEISYLCYSGIPVVLK